MDQKASASASGKRKSNRTGKKNETAAVVVVEEENNVQRFVNKKAVTNAVIPEIALEKMGKLLIPYQKYIKDFIWSINSSSGSPFEPPKGFSIVLDWDAPCNPILFSPTKLFYGQSAKLIRNPMTKTRSELIDEHWIYQHMDTIKKKLANNFKDHNDATKQDVEYYKKFKQDPMYSLDLSFNQLKGSFIGLYSSQVKTEHGFEKQYWIVAQAGVKDASEQIYENMEQKFNMYSPEVTKVNGNPTTLHDIFAQDRNIPLARQFGSKLRAMMIAEVMKILDLVDDGSGPDIENITFDFSTDERNNNLTYRAATLDPEICSNGMLYLETPSTGIQIIKGPPQIGREFGTTWKMKQGLFACFPANLGKQDPNYGTTTTKGNNTSITSSLISESTRQRLSKQFVWKASSSSQSHIGNSVSSTDNTVGELPEKLYATNYKSIHQISSQFSQLGYNPDWGLIQLEPVIVRMVN